MSEFYIYVYLDPRYPGEYTYGQYSFEYKPFYVGKGKDKRHLAHLVSEDTSYKYRTILKIRSELNKDPIIIKYQEGLAENDAFLLETDMILTIGKFKDGGPLTNIASGGAGGNTLTEEAAKERSIKYSNEGNPFFGKSNKGNKKCGNGSRGKHHTDESKKKISDTLKMLYATGQKEKPTMSAEDKLKRSEAMKQNNPMHDKVRAANMGEKLKGSNNPSAKKWLFSNGQEEHIIIGGFAKFCKEHGLSHKIMRTIACDIRKDKYFKGWTVKKL